MFSFSYWLVNGLLVETERKGRRWWYAAGVLWIDVMGHNSTSKGGDGKWQSMGLT